MYLLDTNVISETRKPRPSPAVMQWLQANDELLYLSVISLGEIRMGIDRLAEGAKRRALEGWLSGLQERFEPAIISFDRKAALAWGSLEAKLAKEGRSVPTVDAQLAATALANNMVLVTRDASHFAPTRALLKNPWD